MKRLRFFFDPGSGTCLWSANDDARAACGYAVDHQALPLSDSVKAELTRLIAAFDTSIDWGNPTERGPAWSRAAEAAFLQDADRVARLVQDELGGAGVEIVAEHRSASGTSLMPDRVDRAHPRRP